MEPLLPVTSPLDNQQRGNLLPLPQTNENRLNHGQNLKIINLKRDRASQDSGNVPFKKN